MIEDTVADRPARQCSGDFLHIGFAVMTDTQREQFHQFASEVLVRLAFAIRLRIQPNHHGRVFDDRSQEIAKFSHRMLPQQVVLAFHHSGIGDLQVAGSKVIVPHQRHAFGQWIARIQHPVEPPSFQSIDVTGTDRRVTNQLLQ